MGQTVQPPITTNNSTDYGNFGSEKGAIYAKPHYR
jgi:hypothetical protein